MKKLLISVLAASLCFGTMAYAGEQAHGGHDAKPHWGYAGEGAPEHWGDLDPKFAACKEGKSQSPINITGAVEQELPEINFAYGETRLMLTNNGHTIKADYESGSEIEVDGKTYKLLQFHFHTPSENNIEGKSYPMEAHLVHADADGNLAVIGVMFEEGAANSVVEKIWKYMPAQANSDMVVSTDISVMDMLPENKEYYSFSGSLTTPPCTEGVKWMVLKNAVTGTADQFKKFETTMHGHTNRPVQPLNDRVVAK